MGTQMNKLKVTKKNSNIILTIKSEKGQQLNMREIEAINKHEVDGLSMVEVIYHKKDKFELKYNLTGYMTLLELVSAPINKATFAGILDNIFGIIKKLEECYFGQTNLLLDSRYVLVNPSTRKITMIYVPILFYNYGVSTKDFFLSLATRTVFMAEEDTEYVKEYIGILNDGINFSQFELEEYIKRINGKIINTMKDNRCPSCGATNQENASFCRKCGYKLVVDLTRQEKIYNPLADTVVQNAGNINLVQSTAHVKPKIRQAVNVDEGTVVLGSQKLNNPVVVHLRRVSNGELITVDKDEFKIGKDKENSNYCISDNGAISRHHATIIAKNGRYYVVDNKSTNKTYVDNHVIEPGNMVEVFQGTQIKLANEVFVFLLDDGMEI